LAVIAAVVLVFTGCENPVGEGEKKTPTSTAPENVRVLPAGGQLTVLWDAVENAGSYAVYCGTSETLDRAWGKNTTTDTVTVISGLANGLTYYVWVEAVGTMGISEPVSGIPAGAFVRPEVPTVNIMALDGEITVRMTKSTSGGTPTGYIVRWGETDSIEAAEEAAITLPLYRRTELTNGTPYYVWVKAVNEIGESAFTEVKSAAPSQTSTFEDFDEFSNWLKSKPFNTAAAPYPVKLIGINIKDFMRGTDPLGLLFKTLKSKYVALDLSECTCAYDGFDEGVIPDIASNPSSGRSNSGLGIVSLVFPQDVISIGAYLLAYSGVVSLGLPAELQTVGNDAFYQCSSLTSVTFPAELQTVGNYAFYQCSSLTSVTFPAELQTVGTYAFYQCSSLTSVTFPAELQTIGNYAFSRCSSLVSVTFPAAFQTIGTYAFSQCSSLVSVTFPAELQTIGTYAFSQCSSLASVDFQCELTEIPSSMFRSCSALASIILPDSVTKIAAGVFEGCTSLKFIHLPKNLTDYTYGSLPANGILVMELDDDAPNFQVLGNALVNKNTKALAAYPAAKGEVEIPDGVTSIAASLFKGNLEITGVSIPAGVTSISTSLFSGCSNLETITLPDSITSIDDTAFSGCSSIETITLPGNLTTIGYQAFSPCTDLKTITVPNKVTSIDGYAFAFCTSLETVTIEGEITTMGDYVFRDCTNLERIVIAEGVTQVCNYMFSNCISNRIDLPTTIINIGVNGLFGTGSAQRIAILIVRATVPPQIAASALPDATGLTAIGTIYVPDASLTDYAAKDTDTPSTYSWKAYYDAGKLKKLSELTTE
jgi:hypothetical protein